LVHVHTILQINHSKDADLDLDDNGILRNAVYACRSCVTWLPKKPHSVSTFDVVDSHTSLLDDESTTSTLHHTPDHVKLSPPLALVNGHYRGRVPVQLVNLNRTELSMVSLINCVYTLSMLKPGAHYGSTGTVFSILNDVHAIASVLPRMPTLNEIAIMRSADSDSPIGFDYSPYKVVEALKWLTTNNFLYEGMFERPPGVEWSGDGQLSPLPVPHIPTTLSDYDGVSDTSCAAGTDGHPVNPSAPDSSLSEVLLIPSEENRDLFCQVEQIIAANRFEHLIVVLILLCLFVLLSEPCLYVVWCC
jgi:hypothetical protein